jgi:hypothetical protein
MTPKEKAIELFDKMHWAMPHPSTTNAEIYIISKQCALITVDEIIEALLEYDNRNATYELQNMDRDFNYWEEVKKEIENL